MGLAVATVESGATGRIWGAWLLWPLLSLPRRALSGERRAFLGKTLGRTISREVLLEAVAVEGCSSAFCYKQLSLHGPNLGSVCGCGCCLFLVSSATVWKHDDVILLLNGSSKGKDETAATLTVGAVRQ